jgi:hypothetical protein
MGDGELAVAITIPDRVYRMLVIDRACNSRYIVWRPSATSDLVLQIDHFITFPCLSKRAVNMADIVVLRTLLSRQLRDSQQEPLPDNGTCHTIDEDSKSHAPTGSSSLT